ncbi:MAG: CCA tRNA nucleotidyltransferase [Helicobacteraceae bacterium]|jgi:tRNA nucleotidyltransferase (CCA-adding enzyme)|nr:CCA tRNA nucleotidyltransferase [Helicobacteraceae bacterium]
MTLPPRFAADFERVKAALAPRTKRAFFVGGAVRDHFLGRDFEDIDIEIYDIPAADFEILMRNLGAIGVGKSFFVYKMGVFDLSLPRAERKIARGHKGFSVAIENDPSLAARRRDFTINAVMINIFTGEILDFFGAMGDAGDLARRVLRHIDSAAFGEDSLRVLRAARFAAQLNFKIAPETCAICREIALDDLSRERIWGEFEKIARSDFRVKGAFYIISLLIARKLFGFSRCDLNFFRLVKKTPFFYAIGIFFHARNMIFERLNMPKNERRKILNHPAPPKRFNDKFLIAIALKYPLKNWAGFEYAKIYDRAVKLGFLDQKFDPNVKAADLMREGFAGKELGLELRGRILEKVKNYAKQI